MKIDLSKSTTLFENRHVGPSSDEVQDMLLAVNATTIEELIKDTIPTDIRMNGELKLPEALSEHEYLQHMSDIMSKNKVLKSYIGMGYYNTYTPAVIQRNILENPGWYTAYTPYQAEIAQGRLEALVNFQTMIIDLTGMEIANASLLDEGTAAGEAMSMLFSKKARSKKAASTFFVDKETFPQTIDILKTRADGFGIQLEIGNIDEIDYSDPNIFGIYIQNPNNHGELRSIKKIADNAHQNEIQLIVGADLLSLVLMTSPGIQGADIVVGSSQRFGIPLGYGGPHAGFIAARESHKRQMPGRIIGRSVDKHGNVAYRMALQTREQHIRREKATSNICTAQVLLAVMAGMYGVYHGPEGLKNIASKISAQAHILAKELEKLGYEQMNTSFFDTLLIQVDDLDEIRQRALDNQMNFRYFNAENQIGISIDETTSVEDIENILKVFAIKDEVGVVDFNWKYQPIDIDLSCPIELLRNEDFMTHEVFHKYHSEHEMLRYMKHLENKDLSLVHSMISLGSCTMKLNATAEMIPVTWKEVGQMHPFVPLDQAQGYKEMLEELERWLSEITGFDAVSLQPNSGAQGEYAGLMCIRSYHLANNDDHRNIALIPSSAHGTNPASAIMAGMKVVIVACDEQGNIDIEDLSAKAEKHSRELSALMITYPSTHGVFEIEIRRICDIIHSHGGQVYMDGANMNAQVGLTSPGLIGADVCHLNLHKTFCIPHGGGGPGVGPIGVAKHLTPHLPGHHMMSGASGDYNMPVSAAPYGSASICAISYGYIAMMGPVGLRHATETAILNANYILARLTGHYEVLYTGKNNRCAHELIIDCRDFKKSDIEVQDIAKRLMDYGYHAPTVSFPVPGTMMIEPTESETKEEIDRFCDAMIEIRKEIQAIINGISDPKDNLLLNAPHTAAELTHTDWNHPYSREQACYPLPYVKNQKFWPSVGKIDNAYGDRNLMCTCAPISEYTEEYVEPQLSES